MHYAAGSLHACGTRRTAIADVLLTRVVRRLNHFIKPDITVFLGDMLDNGGGLRAREEREHLFRILAKLESPYIIIPGNHDGDIDQFHATFPRAPETLDVNGVRLLTFLDAEEPGYNARRSAAGLARMDAARRGFDGPIVSIQHVPLFKPGAGESPYAFTNAAEVWDAFEQNNFALALSGHWHKGGSADRSLVVPGLCESPFAFLEITIDGDDIQTKRHELRMPDGSNLIDYHVHTPFAYCSENMDVRVAIALAEEFNLAGLAFTEHSGQLYFDRDTFWSAAFTPQGIDSRNGRQLQMPDYLDLVGPACPPAYLGLEIDSDDLGRPVVRQDAWDAIDIRVGSVHWLDCVRGKPDEEVDLNAAADEMLARVEKFAGCGIQALAHPLRIFRKWPEEDLPKRLLPGIIQTLAKHGVAAEVNFHNQRTSTEFIRLCLHYGVKFVFGSDSHNLCEVGEFQPHLDLMRKCGIGFRDLPNVMADLRP